MVHVTNSGCAPAAVCVLHFRNLNVYTKPQKLQPSRDARCIDTGNYDEWHKSTGETNFLGVYNQRRSCVCIWTSSSIVCYKTPDSSIQNGSIRLSHIRVDCSAGSWSGDDCNIIEFQFGEEVAALCYGGAAVTVGDHNELQKVVQDKHETALFIH